jgi:aspartate-semialdehyde dehydrogenase
MARVAICGATGAVGIEVIKCLKALEFPMTELTLYASARSAGKEVEGYFVKEFNVEEATKHDFVFLCVSGDFSKEYAHEIIKGGAVVIDNSSAFRYDENVPLVVPEINSDVIGDSKLIANPNCTTAILAVALHPIYKEFGLKKVIVSTYQATSGAGQPAMEELKYQTQVVLDGGEAICEKFAYPIPFNLIPQIDVFQENDYTKEEMKVTWETRKIFGAPDLKLSCTAVRIPTFRAHSESVTIETEKPVDVERVKELIEMAPGVKLMHLPMPLTATEQFDVEVGRIRKNDVFGDNGLDFFVCGDQLLKGAALNAVQIAKFLTS